MLAKIDTGAEVNLFPREKVCKLNLTQENVQPDMLITTMSGKEKINLNTI